MSTLFVGAADGALVGAAVGIGVGCPVTAPVNISAVTAASTMRAAETPAQVVRHGYRFDGGVVGVPWGIALVRAADIARLLCESDIARVRASGIPRLLCESEHQVRQSRLGEMNKKNCASCTQRYLCKEELESARKRHPCSDHGNESGREQPSIERSRT
jgi:hypothetical protein